jgi:hypothetical protein
MNRFTQPAEQLTSEAKDYIDLRLDEVKLAAAKGLSVSVSKLVGLLLITSVATNLILVLAFGLVLILGEIIGSYAWAALIIAAILGVAVWILISKRDALFKNTFVPVFVKLFFPADNDDEKAE